MPFVVDSSDLKKARDLLMDGDVVAIPTETVYGLAASISKQKGLEKIFSTKQRPFFDPLIVHVASFEQARELVRNWPPLADFLARWFWPGPLTLVLPKAAHVNDLITSGLDTVALRFPAHPLAQELIKMAGPLAAPSANRFGRTSPSNAQHVRDEFENLMVIDGGPCEIGLESTVVSVTPDEVSILRPGGITQETIEEALTRWSHPARVTRAVNDVPDSPGNMKHHYMPSVPLAIVNEDFDLQAIAKDLKLSKLPVRPMELDLTDDPTQAARRLYSEMRRLSESGADLLFVTQSSARTGGLWAAVWDRLGKAASWTPGERSRI